MYLKLFYISTITILTLFISNLVSSNTIEHDGALEIKLEHALTYNDGIPIFTDRGNITIQSLRIGQATINHKQITLEESELLQNLANENKFYQIRATVTKDNRNVNNGNTYLSTIKACMLAESELDDRISIFLDSAGRVNSISIIIASKSSCEGANVPSVKLRYFSTNVYVRHIEMGPIPDTATYIQRLEREKEAKERGEGKDNRSFLAKYWMYIVPVVIVMVISSASNADNPAGAAAS